MLVQDKWNAYPDGVKATFLSCLIRTAGELNKLEQVLARLNWDKRHENIRKAWESALNHKQTFCAAIEAEKGNIMNEDTGAAAVQKVLEAAQRAVTPRSKSAFDDLFDVAGDLFDKEVLSSKSIYKDARAEWYMWETILQTKAPSSGIEDDDNQSMISEPASAVVSMRDTTQNDIIEPTVTIGKESIQEPLGCSFHTAPKSDHNYQKDAESRLRKRLKDLENAQNEQASTSSLPASPSTADCLTLTEDLLNACFPPPSQQHVPHNPAGAEEDLSDSGSNSSASSRRSSVSSIGG
jgi:hypothetical protein